MQITTQQLQHILPNAGAQAGVFVSALNMAMGQYEITTPGRIAAFVAQVGHESAQLTRTVENLNYTAEALTRTWPTRFTPVTAAQVARQPDKIANIVYASRFGNGPPCTGDGWRYRGRGLIQITGWQNYQACGTALKQDFIQKPQLLEQPIYAALSAAWFWSVKGLNALADAGAFEGITRQINAGLNGQADRLTLYRQAMEVLA